MKSEKSLKNLNSLKGYFDWHQNNSEVVIRIRIGKGKCEVLIQEDHVKVLSTSHVGNLYLPLYRKIEPVHSYYKQYPMRLIIVLQKKEIKLTWVNLTKCGVRLSDIRDHLFESKDLLSFRIPEKTPKECILCQVRFLNI